MIHAPRRVVERVVEKVVEKPVEAKPEKKVSLAQHHRDGALALLALLQREGRFVDFVRDSVDGASDADIGAAAREEDPHAAAGAYASGSVAPSLYTRSRVLPMLTRIPVITSDSTRFEQP